MQIVPSTLDSNRVAISYHRKMFARRVNIYGVDAANSICARPVASCQFFFCKGNLKIPAYQKSLIKIKRPHDRLSTMRQPTTIHRLPHNFRKHRVYFAEISYHFAGDWTTAPPGRRLSHHWIPAPCPARTNSEGDAQHTAEYESTPWLSCKQSPCSPDCPACATYHTFIKIRFILPIYLHKVYLMI